MSDSNRARTRIALALGALVAGGLVALLLPRAWLFVPSGTMAHAGHDAAAGEQYACPMFCVMMESLPADRRCPVCGMEMTLVSAENRLNRAEREMVGLQVERLERRSLSRRIRVVGEVDYDETRLTHITTRVAGWIEEVWVDTKWSPVTKGEKLASIYAPDLYAAQQEYLVAASNDTDLAESAARRLRLLGIGDQEIEAIRRSGKPQRSLVLRAPRDGIVTERQVVEGAAVARGARLYSVADLSRVWVQAEVFERELPWIRVGQTVQLLVEGAPREFEGRVAFIDPALDPRTRTARVRIEVDNPTSQDGARQLRIGQRVDAWVESPLAPALAIPRSAVLSTGNRTVVYVLRDADGNDPDPSRLPDPVHYVLVEVRVGPRSGDSYHPLLSGDLNEDSVVVTHGNLLLDSQAQLSGEPSLLFPDGSRAAPADPHAGHGGG